MTTTKAVLRTVEETNRKAFERLKAAHDSPGLPLLALLGAGASVADGYPTWDKLVVSMEEHARGDPGQSRRVAGELRLTSLIEDAPLRAEACRRLLREPKYLAFLKSTFASKPKQPISEVAKSIARLSVCHFLTTNYEDVLPRAYKAVGRGDLQLVDWCDGEQLRDLNDFLLDLHNLAGPRRYCYLHGSVARPESIVLTEQDYLKRYVLTEEVKRKLFLIFSLKLVVFIGFSLQDPDLMFLQREAWATLRGAAARHFAILSAAPEQSPFELLATRQHMSEKYGIEPVFYAQTPDGGHGNLLHLLNALQGRGELPSLGVRTAVAERTAPSTTRAVTSRGSSTQKTRGSTAKTTAPVEAAVENSRVDSDDPQKGRWGGKATRNGRQLSAYIQAYPDDDDWFGITLYVRNTPRTRKRKLNGAVVFHLHDSFYPAVREVKVNAWGIAKLELESYGSFTVGAVVDNGKTQLELDLADVPGVPAGFIEE